MSSIAQPVRRYTASGKDIEAEFPLPELRDVKRSQGVAIRISGLEKRFGDMPVLRGIDLDIAAGSFVAIVGKSGCGKSTLLRLLMGLDEPTGGSIGFIGSNPAEPVVSRIVFQEPRLLPWASVADNVRVGLPPGTGRDNARQAALSALADVQLAEKATEWPSRLSGGQRQRVALARALVGRPDFLAMDEPLGALDALTRITMQRLVERIWVGQGFTTLFVTHDVAEAVALADRVIVLDEGRIALDLTLPEARPRTRGTPEFARHEAQLLAAIFGGAS